MPGFHDMRRCGFPGIILALMLGPMVAGCSRGGRPEPDRYPVSGTVMLDGQPLREGRVCFIAVSRGLIDSIPVKDGRFSGKAVGGEPRVEFHCIQEVPYAESGYTPMPGETPPATVKMQMLPAHLNTESRLIATVQSAGENEFTFDLSTRPPSAANRGQP